MDRSLIEGDPHAIIEGMMIGAYATGADEGYIYCRAEYPLAIERLKTGLAGKLVSQERRIIDTYVSQIKVLKEKFDKEFQEKVRK